MSTTARIIALLIALIALSGCKAHQAVNVVTKTDTVRLYSTDTIRVTDYRLKVDSIKVRDTTKVYLDGGTKVVERTKYVDRWRIDSTGIVALRVRCDSLSKAAATTQVVTKTETVNVLKWWQRVLMGVGGIAIVFAGTLVGYRYRKK